jgi:hypothetical protein
MNKDIITQVLQEILQEDPNYFFPKQLHILTWKSKKITGALITKINGQRYLGLPQKDQKGQDYWRYKLLPNPESSGSGNSALPDNIAKFNQRQAKAQDLNHGKSNNSAEQSFNQQSQSNS